MKYVRLLFLIFLAILFSGCTSERNNDYEAAMIRLQEKEEELADTENCIFLLREKIDSINSTVNNVASDLDFSLDGNYYDLYDANDSASDELEWIDSIDPCP